MRGLQAAGVVACLKHYPGIGAVTKDPHATLPVVTRALGQFRQSELYPYQALIPAGPDMIMATDVLVPKVDPPTPPSSRAHGSLASCAGSWATTA